MHASSCCLTHSCKKNLDCSRSSKYTLSLLQFQTQVSNNKIIMTLPNSILSLFSTNSFHFLITYFTWIAKRCGWRSPLNFVFYYRRQCLQRASPVHHKNTHNINIAVMIIIMRKKLHIIWICIINSTQGFFCRSCMREVYFDALCYTSSSV